MRDAVIVVVDDEEPIVRVIAHLLNHAGFPTLGTTDPEEAIRVVAANSSVRLIISDVLMPNLAGPEMVRQALRLRDDDVRVVFMSGAPERLPHRRTDHFLQKPLNFGTLARELQNVLANPSISTSRDGLERRRLR